MSKKKSGTIEDFRDLFAKIKILAPILSQILPLIPSHLLILAQ